MRRVWVLLATASLVAAWGCGNSYNFRLERTLDDMRYLKRLDDNLTPAPTKGKLEELLIFVRPPKNLQPAKEFLLPLPDPSKFDLAISFLESQAASEVQQPSEGPTGAEAAKSTGGPKQSLHMIARVKRPKNPNAKKKEEPVVRGEYIRDVLALLNAAYAPPEELTPEKFKETKKKLNTFRHHSFDVGGKNIQVFLYVPKNDPYEVALVFEYPKSEHSNLFSKIELCLESFAVGLRARNAFSGGVAPEASGGTPAAPAVF
jgi:hypothetical protein